MKALLTLFIVAISIFAKAQDVVINLTGVVYPSPCTVDTGQLSLNIGKVYASELSVPGSATRWVNETLKLSNCPNTTNAVIAVFGGTQENGLYANSGTAKNVGIELRTATGTILNNNTVININVDSLRRAELPIMARAVSRNGQATDGTINSFINIIYTYQ